MLLLWCVWAGLMRPYECMISATHLAVAQRSSCLPHTNNNTTVFILGSIREKTVLLLPQELNLGFNQLYSEIPLSWGASMTGLTRVLFSNNTYLCGRLPGGRFNATGVVALGGTSLNASCPQPPPSPPLPPSPSPSPPVADVALLQLKLQATVWPGTLSGWEFGQDPCTDSWTGVVCSGGLPVSVDLTSYGIAGVLPDSLLFVPSLKSIVLADNAFSGSLPAAWSHLTALTKLDLSLNQLSGLLPEQWSTLTGMKVCKCACVGKGRSKGYGCLC